MASSALRLALLATPSVAVAVIGVGLWVGAPRAVRAARLFGGPTSGPGRVGWRIEVVEGGRDAQRRVAGVGVEVITAGGARAAAVTDAEGSAEVAVVLGAAGREDVVVRDAGSGHELARGTAHLPVEAWSRGARRRGGWLPAKATGALGLVMAPARGALAIPFESELLVRVSALAKPVPDAEVELACDGIAVRQGRLRTDAFGETRHRVAPQAHASSCTVVARHGTREGRLHVGVPVIPGALLARRDGATIVAESPVPRAVAFVALVTEGSRLGARRVPLAPSGTGAVGRIALEPHERSATFAVVSSEADFRSPSLVGWPIAPLSDGPGSEPPRTFDVHDQLLLDGVGDALAVEERRVSAVQTATLGALGLVGLASLIGFGAAARGSRWAWVAVVLVGFGFAAYAAFVATGLGRALQ